MKQLCAVSILSFDRSFESRMQPQKKTLNEYSGQNKELYSSAIGGRVADDGKSTSRAFLQNCDSETYDMKETYN